MQKQFVFVLILTLLGYISKGQLSSQDKVALDIPLASTYSTSDISSYIKSHYQTDSERVRAIFIWVANNINYDVEAVRLKKKEIVPIVNVLKTRKAVCQGYAELFVELCKECNVTSTLIPGYTKLPNGSIGDLSHAWTAVQLNNNWFLFDPTWAAGSVRDNSFVRDFSNRYYKNAPEEMIKDHMPFDPMYQFLKYPLRYEEFNAGASVKTSTPFFNYSDTIRLYNTLDSLNRVKAFARRINGNGEKNKLIYEVMQVLNKNEQAGESTIGFNAAVLQLNQGTALFNRYIGLKNNRFSEIKDGKEIQEMIDGVLQNIKTAYSMLQGVNADNDEQRRSLQSINSALTKLYHAADEENIFLKRYLQTDRSLRKSEK